MIPPRKALDGLEELGLDEQTREAFLSGNASRAYGLTV